MNMIEGRRRGCVPSKRVNINNTL